MRIVFWNCGGTGNLGDDLCHLGAVEKCRQIYGEFQAHRIFRLNEKTLELVNSADLLAIGGGQILDNSDFLELLMSFEIKVPYAFFGVGIGSFSDIDKHAKSLKAETWGVRNQKSADILLHYGIVSQVEDDLSHLVPIAFEPRSERRTGMLNLKNVGKDQKFMDDLRAALLNQVTLVSFNTTARHQAVMDGELCDVSDSDDTALMDRIADGREVIGYRGGYDDPARFAGQIGRFHWAVVERFHAAVLARRAGLDFLAINSSEKVERAMKEWGLEDRLVDHDPKAIGDAISALCKIDESTTR